MMIEEASPQATTTPPTPKHVVKVPLETLQQMVTNTGISVLDLSNTSKVMLIFLRMFTCAFCKEAIADVAQELPFLLMNNTVPVFVHMESKAEADVFFSSYSNPVVNNLMRVEDPTGNTYYQAFGLKNGLQHLSPKIVVPAVARVAGLFVTKGYTNYISPLQNFNRIRVTQFPGLFVIENGQVINAFAYNSISTRPDYVKMMVEAEEFSCGCDTPPQVVSMSCDCEEPAPQELPTSSESQPSAPRTLEVSIITTEQQESASAEAPAPIHPEIFSSIMKKTLLAQKKRQQAKKNKAIKKMSSATTSSASTNCVSSSGYDSDEEAAIKTQVPENVQQLLNNSKLRPYFKIHTIQERNNENYLFWTEVKLKYKNIQSEERRKQKAKYIIDTFFNPTSLLEVNTSQALVEQCKSLLAEKGAVLELFDKVISDIEIQVLTDSYNRFKRLPSYHKMVAEQILNKKRKT